MLMGTTGSQKLEVFVLINFPKQYQFSDSDAFWSGDTFTNFQKAFVEMSRAGCLRACLVIRRKELWVVVLTLSPKKS